MALTNYKITDGDISTKGVVAAPDKLTGTAAQNKAIFDRLIREILKVDINNVIDALVAASGASEIGFTAITGLAQNNVQAAIGALKSLTDSKADDAGTTAALALKADKTIVDAHFKSVSFNSSTGVFTFTRENGTTVTFDTAMEKIATNWEYVNTDEHPQSLKLTLADGTVQYISLSSFITETEFDDSTEIDFSVSNHHVTAHIKAGSITDSMLASDLMAMLEGYVQSASNSATAAAGCASNALAYKNAAEAAMYTAESAKDTASAASSVAVTQADEASRDAAASKSWAVGGTGTREGEDTNNAKYWAEQAQDSAQSDMCKSDYDPDETVKNAGGIVNYAVVKDSASDVSFALGCDSEGLYFKFE